MTRSKLAVALLAGTAALVQPADAKVIKFEVVKTESPAFEGRSFGTVGTYDRIIGRATIAVSPSDPHNAVIADIDKAPRNAQGQVEYTADFYILKPVDLAKGNGAIFYEASNRGNKAILARFNYASARSNDQCRPGTTPFLASLGRFPSCRRRNHAQPPKAADLQPF